MGWATKHMGSENRLPHPWCNPCSRIWIPHFQTHPYIIIYHIVSLYLIVSPWYSLNHRISPFLLVKSHLIQLDFLKTIENHHEIPWNPFCSCLNPNKPCVIFQTGRVEVSGCCCFWHVTAGCPSWPNEVVDCSQGRLRLLRHEAVSSWLVDGNGIIWKYMGMYIYVYQYISLYVYIYIYVFREYIYWLVVWNMIFMTSIYWECHHPNWQSHISPHLCLGFLFLVVHFRPARPPPASRPPPTTCPHTTCHHATCHHTTCPHTTYSHTGVALGDIDLHFAWQAWHCTWRHRPSLCVAGVALHLATSTVTLRGRRGCWRGRRGTWRHRPTLCVAGVALMALCWFWWRAWFPVDAVGAAAVCVAGMALGDIDLHFARQAWWRRYGDIWW